MSVRDVTPQRHRRVRQRETRTKQNFSSQRYTLSAGKAPRCPPRRARDKCIKAAPYPTCQGRSRASPGSRTTCSVVRQLTLQYHMSSETISSFRRPSVGSTGGGCGLTSLVCSTPSLTTTVGEGTASRSFMVIAASWRTRSPSASAVRTQRAAAPPCRTPHRGRGLQWRWGPWAMSRGSPDTTLVISSKIWAESGPMRWKRCRHSPGPSARTDAHAFALAWRGCRVVITGHDS